MMKRKVVRGPNRRWRLAPLEKACPPYASAAISALLGRACTLRPSLLLMWIPEDGGSLDIVLWLTLELRAISVSTSPASRRLIASAIWWGVNLSLRPNRTPLALARLIPSSHRDRRSANSNSAIAPSTLTSNRPWALVVSMVGQSSTLKPAPRSEIVCSVLSRSRALLASLSSWRPAARRPDFVPPDPPHTL